MLDLGFVVGSNTKDGVLNQVKFILQMLPKYSISLLSTQFGVVSSTSGNIILSFTNGAIKDNIIDTLNKLNYPIRNFNFLKALKYANKNLFTSANGARMDAKKSLVVFIDDNIEVVSIEKHIKDIKEKDVKIVFVVMNETVDTSILDKMADGNIVKVNPPIDEADINNAVTGSVEGSLNLPIYSPPDLQVYVMNSRG